MEREKDAVRLAASADALWEWNDECGSLDEIGEESGDERGAGATGLAWDRREAREDLLRRMAECERRDVDGRGDEVGEICGVEQWSPKD